MSKPMPWISREQAAKRLGLGVRLTWVIQLLVDAGKIESGIDDYVSGFDVELIARANEQLEREPRL